MQKETFPKLDTVLDQIALHPDGRQFHAPFGIGPLEISVDTPVLARP